MTPQTSLALRPQQVPSPGIPMGARSVGSQAVGIDFAMCRQGRPIVQIFWFDEGTGEVQIGKQRHQVVDKNLAVYFPGTTHILKSQSDYWSWSFWTMDGPLAVDLVAGFGLTEGIHPTASLPHGLFAQLHQAIMDVSAGGERYASSLAYQLLAEAAFPRQKSLAPNIQCAIACMDSRWADPQLSIQSVAEVAGMHRSALTRGFRDALGVSPIVYLTSKRIRHAQNRLKSSSDSIQAVAIESGFSDPSYFTRVFRRCCGMSPLQFRFNLETKTARAPTRHAP